MMEARRQQEEVERQEALGRQREADEERARLSSWGHRFGIDSGWRGLGRGQAQRHRGGRRTRELGTLSFSPNSPPFGCRGRGDGRGQQQRWDDFPQQEQGDIREVASGGGSAQVRGGRPSLVPCSPAVQEDMRHRSLEDLDNDKKESGSFAQINRDRVEQAKRVAAVLQRREEMQKLCLDLVPLGKRKTRHEEKGWKAGSTSEEHRKRIREMKKGNLSVAGKLMERSASKPSEGRTMQSEDGRNPTMRRKKTTARASACRAAMDEVPVGNHNDDDDDDEDEGSVGFEDFLEKMKTSSDSTAAALSETSVDS